MEQIVFPVPSICEFLTKESKLRIYYTTERDEQGSKINDFFLRSEDLFNEMNWQKKLRGAYPPPLLPPARNRAGAKLSPRQVPVRPASGLQPQAPIPRAPCRRPSGV